MSTSKADILWRVKGKLKHVFKRGRPLDDEKALPQAVIIKKTVSVSFDRPIEGSRQKDHAGTDELDHILEKPATQSHAFPREVSPGVNAGEPVSLPGSSSHSLSRELQEIRHQSSEDEQPGHTQVPPVGDLNPSSEDPIAVYPGMTLRFAYEDETDYTIGPIRLVAAADSKRTCTALLMNLDLSKKIQRAVEAQRAFEKDERKIESEQSALANFMARLHCDIRQHESYLDDLEQPSGFEQASMRRATDVQQIRAQLENLRILLSDTEARHSNNEVLLQTKAQELRHRQGLVNAYLEEAFVGAYLLKPADDRPDTPVEAMTIDNELARLREQLQDSHDEVVPMPESIISLPEMFAPPALSAEQYAQQLLRDACHEAREELKTAQHAFHSREAAREDERRWNECMAECDEETMDATPEAFDLRWVVQNRELTRRLIDAEEGFTAAKREALAAGVELEICDDEEFGDGDGGEGGYPESLERAMVLNFPVDDVYEWMEGVQDTADDELDTMDCEYWEADDLNVGDEASAFACGKERERIQRWRDACDI